jgi:hypothetical protein
MVLATDMGKHFPVLTAVQAKLLDHYDASKGAGSRYDALTSEQQHIMLQLFLKSADLGHCGLPIRSHLEWVQRIQDEFFRQGDAECARGLPLSPLADRTKPGALWGSNQVRAPFRPPVLSTLTSMYCTTTLISSRRSNPRVYVLAHFI